MIFRAIGWARNNSEQKEKWGLAEISNVMVLGVLVGIAILALKTGLGCDFANLKRRENNYVAFIYPIFRTC